MSLMDAVACIGLLVFVAYDFYNFSINKRRR